MPTEYPDGPTVVYLRDLLTCPPRTSMEEAKIKVALQLLNEGIGPIDCIAGFVLAQRKAADSGAHS